MERTTFADSRAEPAPTGVVPHSSPRGSRVQLRTPPGAAWIGTGVFLLCLFARVPALFLRPRFWAEEGSLYYANMQHLRTGAGLLWVTNANYQFLTDLAVEATLQIPARYGAVVTTYLALAVALLCCRMIAGLLASRGCSTLSVVAACALFALQPAGYEVFLSATNLQWVCSVVALMLLLPEKDEAPAGAIAGRCLLLVALGLTGTTSCILLPVFALGSWLRPTRERLWLTGTLAAVTVLQAAVVLAHLGHANRSFALSAASLVALALQTALTDVVPQSVVDGIGAAIHPHDAVAVGIGWQVTAVGVTGVALLAMVARDVLGRSTALLLSAALVFVSLVNVFGALGEVEGLLSGWAGGRYFFLANTCLIVIACAALDSSNAVGRAMAAAFCALFLSNAAVSAFDSRWTGIFTAGPSHMEQVDACDPSKPCPVTVWPVGAHLSFTIDQDRIGGARGAR